MKISIVMGAGGTGKRAFLLKQFPEASIVSVGDIQRALLDDWGIEALPFDEYFRILQTAHDRVVEETINCIKNQMEVVMEHTLFKKSRRKEVYERLRAVTDEPIDLYVMMPSDEQIQRNIETNINYKGCSVEDIKKEIKLIEMPSEEEGFDHIYIVTEQDVIEK